MSKKINLEQYRQYQTNWKKIVKWIIYLIVSIFLIIYAMKLNKKQNEQQKQKNIELPQFSIEK